MEAPEIPFDEDSKKVKGRKIHPPIDLCARNFERPMYSTLLYMCYYCQKHNCERDFYETNAGRWYIQIQLCKKCAEFNRASQEAGREVLLRYVNKQYDNNSKYTQTFSQYDDDLTLAYPNFFLKMLNLFCWT